MFKDVLNHMAGAADFASIGLVIFFLVFLVVSCRAMLQPKHDLTRWSRLPIDLDETSEARHE